MKPIATPDEPACLAAWRAANPTATWDAFKDANRDAPDGARGCNREVLEALLAAQHHLCAYCEIELDPPLWAEVEHWRPKDPKLDPTHNWGLDFSNFMAGCEGGTKLKEDAGRKRARKGKGTHHCGAVKANEDLTATLLDPRKDLPPTPVWTFDGKGHIRVADGLDPAFTTRAAGTIEHLNLDSPTLQDLRAEVWATLSDDVQRVWEALGGTDEAYAEAFAFVAAEKLAVDDGRLRRFWSTARCFLAGAAEAWLSTHPDLAA